MARKDPDERRAYGREASRRFRKENPEKIKDYNEAYYKANQQEILEGLRQKTIEKTNATGIWIHESTLDLDGGLPALFNHVDCECACNGRRCKECKKVKCIGWFYEDKRRHAFTTLCKYCYGEKTKERKRANQDRVDASSAQYNARTKEKRRAYWIKRNYNLTEEQYQNMLSQQEGKCAICNCISDKTLHIDHSHATGQVRALLCTRCNSVIGYANESIERLELAIKYLECYQQEGVDHGKHV